MIGLVGLVLGALARYVAPMTVLDNFIPADWNRIAMFAAPIVGGLLGLRLGLLLEGR